MSGNILLVEDNADLVANLTEILEARGYSVRSVPTFAAALEAAKGWVQVALLDFRLPDGDGAGLTARLRAQDPDCEIILLTGFASVESAAAAVRAGAYAYLVKPCATPEVLLTVEQAFKQVRSHSEKRELARRAQVAERLAAVGTLTAGLSHEIRNPLNAASLQLSVLERRIRKLEHSVQGNLIEPLTLVRDEIRRLDHILQDFLEFARPAPVSLRPIAFDALLKRVTDLLSTVAENRGVSLSLSGADGAWVLGDAAQLQQVFMNLCLNAFDASPSGSRVAVVVERLLANDEVVTHVDDSGSGVPPDVLPRIFEPFFTTKASGSGLGLPISHAIVTQHGGRVVIGRSPAGGARFSVHLPGCRPGEAGAPQLVT